MLKKLFVGAATTSLLMAASMSASAATYISKLEYWDNNGVTLVDPEFGYVVLEEQADGKTVNVTAYLNDNSLWQQSGANNIFAFNLADDDGTVITEAHSSPDVIYSPTSYTHAPWGTFTDHFYVAKSGKNGRLPGAFEFTAFNAGGLTFAGVGATFDGDNRLLTTGTGNRFNSNSLGWWFMGHIQPEASGSINIAARDAFCTDGCSTGAVPEPGTWALMILGFGAAGAMLRRRTLAIA